MRIGRKATMILALDPGKNLGLAWLSSQGDLIATRIASLDELPSIDWRSPERVVVGNGTGSAALQARLSDLGVIFEVIDETGSTLEGRRLFFAAHPPRGLVRLLPPGLWVPPRPIDDYAAYAIGLRSLQRSDPDRS